MGVLVELLLSGDIDRGAAIALVRGLHEAVGRRGVEGIVGDGLEDGGSARVDSRSDVGEEEAQLVVPRVLDHQEVHGGGFVIAVGGALVKMGTKQLKESIVFNILIVLLCTVYKLLFVLYLQV